MFGFFDKKEREKRANFDRVRDMIISAPPTLRRAALSKMAMEVLNQYTTMRDAGNSAEAEKHILKGVDIIRDIFDHTQDPKDFRIMYLPLRGAGMAPNVMNGTMSVNRRRLARNRRCN